MKRFIVFLFSLIFLLTAQAHAVDYTFKSTRYLTKISTQRATADITITFTGDLKKFSSQGDITVWKTKGANGSYSGKIFSQFLAFNDRSPSSASFHVTNLEPNTTYYLSSLDGTRPFTTEKLDSCTPDPNPVAGVEKLGITYESSYVILSQKFDPAQHPCFQNFKASIEIYKEDPAANTDAARVFYTAAVQDKETRKEGIAYTGEFYYYIINLDPNTTYYYRETIEDQTGGGKKATYTGSFPSTKGYVPAGSTQQSFEEHSYRLLAPFPGFTVLMDPELCNAQKAQHKLPPNAICDVNDLLNFAFKMLIGIAAVLLVFRLMLAGYQYITTDVPFLKNTAKTHLAQSALGILLALSAYLILNTINPQLVTNQIHLGKAQVGVEPGNDGLGIEIPNKTLTLSTKSGSVSVKACDETQMVSVSAFGTTFKVQKNLMPSIARINEKWKLLNPAYKIPFSVDDAKKMGGFVCRNTASGKLSYHAYGLAVDINPNENPMGEKLITNMPQSFIQLWQDEGWGWGGKWTGTEKDAMHFSKGTNEGGNMKGE